MTNSLHQEPERDEFKHESPIRAFTTWSVQGLYALGKGFRPSLAHLVPYLNAMEDKEGWRLVQVLEAATGSPSFIFRLEREPSDDELRARYPHLDFQLPAKVATGLRQVTGDMVHAIKGTTWPHRRKEEFYGFADRVNGYAAELEAEEPYVRNREGFEEAGRKIDQAREMDAVMAAAPPAEAIADDPINPKHYGGTACADIGELLTANSYQVLKYNWRLGEKDDPCQEIDKSMWYLDREIALLSEGNVFISGEHRLPDHVFFDRRLEGRSEHTKEVARKLISWNRYGKVETLRLLRKLLLEKRDTFTCPGIGRGLAI